MKYMIAILAYLFVGTSLMLWLCENAEDKKVYSIYFFMSAFWPVTILISVFVWFASIKGQRDGQRFD